MGSAARRGYVARPAGRLVSGRNRVHDVDIHQYAGFRRSGLRGVGKDRRAGGVVLRDRSQLVGHEVSDEGKSFGDGVK